DYYVTNEHLLKPDGTTVSSGEFFGYYVIAKQYYERYSLPIMHTETNLWENDGSVQWLWKEWNCMLRLRQDGVPTVGFTWYSLTDQMDWDTALREPNMHVHPVGLFDLNREIRPVGKCYKQLIDDWRDVLPTQTVCLAVPVVPPAEYGERVHQRHSRAMREIRAHEEAVEGAVN